MITLPDLPMRMKHLKRDQRGYPVPWFVCWLKDGQPVKAGEGEPDFRIIGASKFWTAVSQERCWVCGGGLGRAKVYLIGPMCSVNRVTSEPPCHRECAEFAAKACPFLTRPRQKRDKKGLPEDITVAGIAIERNPGVVALWQQLRAAKPVRDHGGGYLFRLGEPDRIDWWAEGRQATRAEIMASIDSGYPILFDIAKQDGLEAIDELGKMHAAAMKLLPA